MLLTKLLYALYDFGIRILRERSKHFFAQAGDVIAQPRLSKVFIGLQEIEQKCLCLWPAKMPDSVNDLL